MTARDCPRKTRRRWLTLAGRIVGLLLRPDRTGDLVLRSYDRIAPGYDEAWTSHMRQLSLAMLDRLAPPVGARCLDLTCGTGFVTAELARRTAGRVTGVDASAGMLDVARRRHGSCCAFIQADACEYLRTLPARCLDVVTCAWGLGYTRPGTVVRRAARVLRPGGRVGIIDNTLFSLAEVLWSSILAFAERPEALTHVMQVRFLPTSGVLAALMRLCRLAVLARDDGSKTYDAADGEAVVSRLVATGAAAGFEFAADPEHREQVFARFARIHEGRHGTDRGVSITHRWLAAIGEKQ